LEPHDVVALSLTRQILPPFALKELNSFYKLEGIKGSDIKNVFCLASF